MGKGMTSGRRGILSGYRVVDCSVAMAGPMSAQRLGDMGADVIKIEPPTGEWQREMSNAGLRGKRIDVAFRSLNRNKRSLALDPARPEAAAILRRDRAFQVRPANRGRPTEDEVTLVAERVPK